MMHSKLSGTLLAATLLAVGYDALAAELPVETSTKLILRQEGRAAQLAVSGPGDYPIQVQFPGTAEEKRTKAPFLVTPDVFRLEAKQQNRLLAARVSGNLVKERESIVKAVAPSDGSAVKKSRRVSIAVNAIVTGCNKLFYRLKGIAQSMAGPLGWSRSAGANPTPFYTSHKPISAGGESLSDLSYLPLQGSASVTLPAVMFTREVTPTVINDHSGEGRLFHSSTDLILSSSDSPGVSGAISGNCPDPACGMLFSQRRGAEVSF